MSHFRLQKVLKLSESKKKIESKLHELDEMLADIDIDKIISLDDQERDPKINISELDVVDVLHNILN